MVQNRVLNLVILLTQVTVIFIITETKKEVQWKVVCWLEEDKVNFKDKFRFTIGLFWRKSREAILRKTLSETSV